MLEFLNHNHYLWSLIEKTSSILYDYFKNASVGDRKSHGYLISLRSQAKGKHIDEDMYNV